MPLQADSHIKQKGASSKPIVHALKARRREEDQIRARREEMHWFNIIVSFGAISTAQATANSAANGGRDNSTCLAADDIPVGYVKTFSAYSCRGEKQTFANLTSGACIEASNFTTARGYRNGKAPEGHDCSFNFYGASGCKGSYVSAGKDTDGSNNWAECVRNFIGSNGEISAQGSSFMYVCYPSRLS
jgi:hypothetical protein